jgi:hypothetical protein
MAATVLSVVELRKSGAGDGISPGDERKRRYFRVQLSAADSDGGTIAKNAVDPTTGLAIPPVGDLYPAWPTPGFCVLRREASPTGMGGTIYDVWCEYGFSAQLGTSSADVAPWLRPRLVSWSHVPYQRVMEYDADGVQVVNSALDSFEPPIMATKYNRLARVRFAKTTGQYDPEDASVLIGSNNDAPFTVRGSHVVAAFKGLLRNTTADEYVWSDGTHYWNVVHEIEIELEVSVSVLELLDVGYNWLDTSVTPYKKMRMKVYDPDDPGNTVPSPSPQFLDGAGEPWEFTSSSGEPDPLVFSLHVAKDWTPLRL